MLSVKLVLHNFRQAEKSYSTGDKSSTDKFAQMRAIKRFRGDRFFVPRKFLSMNLPWPLPFADEEGQVAIFVSSIHLDESNH